RFCRTSTEKSVKSGTSGRDAGAGGTKRKGPDQFVAFVHRFASRSAIVVDHATLPRGLVADRADKKGSGGIANLAQNRMVSGGVLATAQRIPNASWTHRRSRESVGPGACLRRPFNGALRVYLWFSPNLFLFLFLLRLPKPERIKIGTRPNRRSARLRCFSPHYDRET